MRYGNAVISPDWPISKELETCLLKNAQDCGIKHAEIIYGGPCGSEHLVSWKEIEHEPAQSVH
jgi:hypothetical protein